MVPQRARLLLMKQFKQVKYVIHSFKKECTVILTLKHVCHICRFSKPVCSLDVSVLKMRTAEEDNQSYRQMGEGGWQPLSQMKLIYV